MNYRLLFSGTLLLGYSLSSTGCMAMKMMHEQEMMDKEMMMPYQQADQVRYLQNMYANQFEIEIMDLLAPLFGKENVRVNVYLELDFDETKMTEKLIPGGKEIVSESSSTHDSEENESEKESESSETHRGYEIEYKISKTKIKRWLHPGHISQLNIAVVINKRVVGDENLAELKEQITYLVMASTPFKEQRRDFVHVEFINFLPQK